VAERLGIRWRSRCTPEQKREHVTALQTSGHRVLMLGDGLNDAESLAVADVGVAMGGGSAIAQGHADVLLLRDDLRLIPTLIDTARRARRITRQNMAWAVGYHLLVLPFAVSGMMAPWLAALGMALSSLIVVMNALRLRHRASAEMDARVRIAAARGCPHDHPAGAGPGQPRSSSVLAIWAFFWAVDDGQFDDLDTPAFNALDDDEPRAPTTDVAADVDADQDR
jgi:nitrogen fixation-related uncharacterized protein